MAIPNLQTNWKSFADRATANPTDHPAAYPNNHPLDPPTLIAAANRRLTALSQHCEISEIRAALDQWAAGLPARHVRYDHNTGLQRQDHTGRWSPISSLHAAASSLQLPITPPDRFGQASNNTPGIVVEGFNPPWLLERIHQSTNDSPDGYRPELFVLQHDPIEFLDGLSLATTDNIFNDPRINWYVGPTASRQLSRALTERLGVILPAHLLVTPGLCTICQPSVADTIRSAHAEQSREQTARLNRVRAPNNQRSLEDWRDRFNQATANNPHDNLRVLLPTTRRSTYLRHAAHDLADGFRRLGHHAELFETQHDHHLPSSVGLLRCLEHFQPDLIVVANDTRTRLAKLLPDNIPYVCHLMDPLEHLFDDNLGAAQGPTDFIVGHLYTPLFHRHGYKSENARFAFVPASAAKFHTGPTDQTLATQLACDIAYISHQSESPDQMHTRMCAAFADQPRLLSLMQEARRCIHETIDPDIGANPISPSKSTDPYALSLELTGGDTQRAERFARMYTSPMAERLTRHVVLEWTAHIAQRRGWSFKLFGNGWESHPALSAFAQGPLQHNEALRTAYQSARACLHISRLTNSHQRVFECALAGGLMLRRGPSPDFQAMHAAFYQTLGRDATPERESPQSGIRRYNRKRVPELYPKHLEPLITRHDWVANWLRRPEYVFTHGWYIQQLSESWPSMPLSAYIDASLTNPQETMFTDPTSLESRLEQAITDNHWRQTQIADHHRYAMSHATYDALASNMIALAQDRLNAQAPAPGNHKTRTTNHAASTTPTCLTGASHA